MAKNTWTSHFWGAPASFIMKSPLMNLTSSLKWTSGMSILSQMKVRHHHVTFNEPNYYGVLYCKWCSIASYQCPNVNIFWYIPVSRLKFISAIFILLLWEIKAFMYFFLWAHCFTKKDPLDGEIFVNKRIHKHFIYFLFLRYIFHRWTVRWRRVQDLILPAFGEPYAEYIFPIYGARCTWLLCLPVGRKGNLCANQFIDDDVTHVISAAWLYSKNIAPLFVFDGEKYGSSSVSCFYLL